ncbi:MAG: hypothetical protein QM715_06590 [Nibricoccus sp.]
MRFLRPRALLALTLLPSLAAAQEARPAAPAKSNIEVSTGSAGGTAPTKKQRAVSDDISKSVSSAFKYNPPPPPKSEEELIDLRDVDKPRNQIIRLPKYVVEAKKPPVFNDRNLYSKEMLRRLAYKRYSSSFSREVLNKYHFLGNGDIAYAMMQYEAEERQRNLAEMDSTASMLRISGDDAEAAKTKDDAQNTYMRRSDAGTNINHRSNGQ